MSTIISFVSNSSAAKLVDERTLSIKTACGTVITLNFFDTASMKAVADEIYSGINSAAASASDPVAMMGDLLIASTNDEDAKDEASEDEASEEEASESSKDEAPAPAASSNDPE